jgi:hydroxypyruvate isomerase
MEALHAACQDSGIRIAGFFGHSHGGLRDPSMRGQILEQLGQSIEVAERVGADQLHMFSDGIRRPLGAIEKPPSIPRVEQYFSCIDGLKAAAKLVEGKNITLIVEAINTVFIPGYFWEEAGITVEMCRAVGHPQVRLAFDCFHQQLVGGRLTDNLIAALPYAARVDIGDVPGRHQPGTGEINFAHIRRVLEQHQFDGTITFETAPLGGDNEACVKAIKSVFPF